MGSKRLKKADYCNATVRGEDTKEKRKRKEAMRGSGNLQSTSYTVENTFGTVWYDVLRSAWCGNAACVGMGHSANGVPKCWVRCRVYVNEAAICAWYIAHYQAPWRTAPVPETIWAGLVTFAYEWLLVPGFDNDRVIKVVEPGLSHRTCLAFCLALWSDQAWYLLIDHPTRDDGKGKV